MEIPKWLRRYRDLTSAPDYFKMLYRSDPSLLSNSPSAGEGMSPFVMLWLEIEYTMRLFEMDAVSPDGKVTLRMSLDQRYDYYVHCMKLALDDAVRKNDPAATVMRTALELVEKTKQNWRGKGGKTRGEQLQGDREISLRKLDEVYKYGLSDEQKANGPTLQEWKAGWLKIYKKDQLPSDPTMRSYISARNYPLIPIRTRLKKTS